MRGYSFGSDLRPHRLMFADVLTIKGIISQQILLELAKSFYVDKWHWLRCHFGEKGARCFIADLIALFHSRGVAAFGGSVPDNEMPVSQDPILLIGIQICPRLAD